MLMTADARARYVFNEAQNAAKLVSGWIFYKRSFLLGTVKNINTDIHAELPKIDLKTTSSHKKNVFCGYIINQFNIRIQN